MRGMAVVMPLNEIDKDVTVKQLLNHTSGVPDYFDESVMEEYEKLKFFIDDECGGCFIPLFSKIAFMA